jgi:hypothetical protein
MCIHIQGDYKSWFHFSPPLAYHPLLHTTTTMDLLIIDISASAPNSNALSVIVACIARYSNNSNVTNGLKQESLFECLIEITKECLFNNKYLINLP